MKKKPDFKESKTKTINNRLVFIEKYGKRAISLRGRIDEKMVLKVKRRIEFFLKKNSIEPISLVINSSGGHITSAIRLSFVLKELSCEIKVYVIKSLGVSSLIVSLPGFRIAYSFSQLSFCISVNEIHNDPNLGDFLAALFEEQGAFHPESLFYPIELTRMVPSLGDASIQRGFWYALQNHFSSLSLDRSRRAFDALPDQVRNSLLILKLFGGLFSIFTGLPEEDVIKLIRGEKSLTLLEALDIGLIDRVEM